MSDGRLLLAVALNLLLTVIEVIGGLLSGSLALIADALHNFGDCGSLIIALVARRWSRKAADRQRTFGYGRADVVGALINLTALVVVAFFLVIEAVTRLLSSETIDGWPVIIIATIALVVDIGTVALLWTKGQSSMNMRAAMLHNFSDALASVGVIFVGIAVILWDFVLADVIITIAIAAYVLWQSIGMLRQSIGILMNSAPLNLDLDEIVAALMKVTGVCDVHHLHLWQLDEHQTSLEAHVVIEHPDAGEMESIKHALKQILHDRFEIEHSTLEFELVGHTSCGDSEEGGLIARH